MAFDAGMMRATIHEIETCCRGGKVDKISIPFPEEIVFQIRSLGKDYRLVFSVGASSSRFALSNLLRENPKTPSSFCMLLRKYFSGAKLTSIEQVDFERVAFFCFDGTDEMGFAVRRKIVVEIMGTYSNFIVLSNEDKVLFAYRYIEFSETNSRVILPGVTYALPTKQNGKYNPLTESKEHFLYLLSSAEKKMPLEKFFMKNYYGLSAQIAKMLVYETSGKEDICVEDAEEEYAYDSLCDFRQKIEKNEHDFFMTEVDGIPKEYGYLKIPYLEYNSEVVVRHVDTVARLFDNYFGEKDRLTRIHHKASDLMHLVKNAISRAEHRTEAQKKELKSAEGGNQYKLDADFITSYLYKIKRGMESFTDLDYMVDPPKMYTVTLDSRLSPTQNAQKKYKLYNKAKTAVEVLTQKIAESEQEITYLRSVLSFIESSQCEDELIELREELYLAGYASKMKDYVPKKHKKTGYIVGYTTNGYKVLCGRNNLQNEELTFKVANKNDIWFHVKNHPGSHVILETEGTEPSSEDYTDAAAFAAFHSSVSKSSSVLVDYSQVRNIKKIAGGKPGLVLYHTNYSATVIPKDLRSELS